MALQPGSNLPGQFLEQLRAFPPPLGRDWQCASIPAMEHLCRDVVILAEGAEALVFSERLLDEPVPVGEAGSD